MRVTYFFISLKFLKIIITLILIFNVKTALTKIDIILTQKTTLFVLDYISLIWLISLRIILFKFKTSNFLYPKNKYDMFYWLEKETSFLSLVFI